MTGFPSSRHHACNAFLSFDSKSSTPYHPCWPPFVTSCATFRRVPNAAAAKQAGPPMSLDELRVRHAPPTCKASTFCVTTLMAGDNWASSAKASWALVGFASRMRFVSNVGSQKALCHSTGSFRSDFRAILDDVLLPDGACSASKRRDSCGDRQTGSVMNKTLAVRDVDG